MLRSSALLAACLVASPAAAQEVFVGVLNHQVETPFSLEIEEGGTDLQGGYRFKPIEALSAIGKPAPYIIASVNTAGDTSFVGGGLAWTIGKGPVYFRPGLGLVIHDGPDFRVDRAGTTRTDLGSRVLFEPELGLGVRVNERFSIEAQWTHLSHAQLFNGQQNPGLDMVGLRLNYRTN